MSTLLTDIQPGFACGAHSRGGDGVPHLRPMNVSTDGEISLGDLKLVPQVAAEDAGKWIERGDVLFNNTNSPELVGKTAYYDLTEPRAFSNHMTRLRVNRVRLDPRYCAAWLHQLWRDGEFASRCNNHVSQASISREVLRELEIPLPPIAQQKRIVEAIQRLTARVDAARDRLANVPTILKRFRQAVLAAACSGRLTEEWREEHPAPAKGVLALVTAHIEFANQRRVKRKGKKGDKPTDYALSELTSPEELGDLPAGWAWIPLGNLGVDPLNTVQTGPFGAQLHNDEFVPQGVPVIAVGNLTGMGFSTKGLYFVTEHKARQLARYDVNGGDLLFARSGATLGKVCVAPSSVQDWRMTGHILRARLEPTLVRPEVAVFALWGDLKVKSQVLGNVRGITRPGFNTALLESIWLPVPPLAEQAEIVRRVESLMKLADAVERRVALAQTRADKLTQSILAKAFRGELVRTGIKAETATAQPLARPVVWRFEDFAAVQAEIVLRFPNDPTLGRKKLFKLSYLAAALASAKTERPLKQDAAGPYDGKLQSDAEAHAASQKWFTANKTSRDPGEAHYRKGSRSAEATATSKSLLGERWTSFEKLLAAAKSWDSTAAELHATTHAAWNSLLAEGAEATPEAITARFFAWSPEKSKRFTKWNVDSARQTLTKLGLVPTGKCLVVEGLGQPGLFTSSNL